MVTGDSFCYLYLARTWSVGSTINSRQIIVPIKHTEFILIRIFGCSLSLSDTYTVDGLADAIETKLLFIGDAI